MTVRGLIPHKAASSLLVKVWGWLFGFGSDCERFRLTRGRAAFGVPEGLSVEGSERVQKNGRQRLKWRYEIPGGGVIWVE